MKMAHRSQINACTVELGFHPHTFQTLKSLNTRAKLQIYRPSHHRNLLRHRNAQANSNRPPWLLQLGGEENYSSKCVMFSCQDDIYLFWFMQRWWFLFEMMGETLSRSSELGSSYNNPDQSSRYLYRSSDYQLPTTYPNPSLTMSLKFSELRNFIKPPFLEATLLG